MSSAADRSAVSALCQVSMHKSQGNSDCWEIDATDNGYALMGVTYRVL